MAEEISKTGSELCFDEAHPTISAPLRNVKRNLKRRCASMARLPGSEQRDCCLSRADRLDAVYLRAAQAYMLISMPTGTSTTFGVFQVIESLPSSLARGSHRRRT
jgi:hypothetical protein